MIQKYLFPILLLCLQTIFIILLGLHADYGYAPLDPRNITLPQVTDTAPSRGIVEYYYSMFQDIHVMMFIGFGFLMTFLRKYSFSSVGFNFILCAFVLEWAIIIRGYVYDWNSTTKSFIVDVQSMIVADFVSASVLISMGAVLGKLNPAQLIVMGGIEVVIQTINEWIGSQRFCAFDGGESIFVHVFGAYFGITVAFMLYKEDILGSTKENSSYHSDVFSMIGTIFLFVFWPSFNAGLAFGPNRLRAVVNTYISICASVVSTFICSSILGKGKLDMVHIQNATLAGGVAVGTLSSKIIGLWGAMVIGTLAGVLSVIGFHMLLPLLKRIRLHDTCGVNNLHGMPGILAGISGIVLAFIPSKSLYKEELSYNCLTGMNRSAAVQAGYQTAALILTLAMAISSGAVTGILLRLPIFEKPQLETYFDDELNWHTPEDFTPERNYGINVEQELHA
ncbi:unnamed protein product [Didymodactylos carnosus]|uniref:Ammonium transporter AmtB-like domain-containing protein n=1 Tax=Didymodactylos carnosus TaxID=1234261 RepID=A0A814ULP6_9BILA|nr:unnamed protein product [Didymodactylos carnosus]CAF3940381.1 unnamed protein product [Didymodactylos carnosus]